LGWDEGEGARVGSVGWLSDGGRRVRICSSALVPLNAFMNFLRKMPCKYFIINCEFNCYVIFNCEFTYKFPAEQCLGVNVRAVQYGVG